MRDLGCGSWHRGFEFRGLQAVGCATGAPFTHPPSASVLVAALGIVASRLGAGVERTHGSLHFDRFALAVRALDDEGQRHRVAFLHLLLQVHQHHVVAAGLEFHGLACGQLDGRHLAHLHHVVLHGHLVDLDGGRKRRAGRDQLAILGCLQLHEGAGGFLLRYGGAHSGIFDGDLRLGGGREQRGGDDGCADDEFHGVLLEGIEGQAGFKSLRMSSA